MRAVLRVALALAIAAAAWLLAGYLGAWIGTTAVWPLDRIGAVLAALALYERALARSESH